LALNDPEISIKQKFTQAHYIVQFQIQTTTSTNSASSKSRSWPRMTIHRVHLHT